MDRLKKRFVTLFVSLALILFASFLAAQGPPKNPCASACLQAYLNAVKTCHGNPTCLAAARAEAEACVKGCVPR